MYDRKISSQNEVYYYIGRHLKYKIYVEKPSENKCSSNFDQNFY